MTHTFPSLSRPFALRSVAVAALLLVHGMGVPHQALASPLDLAQAPAGNGGREPAPNIVISVDDSGSMGTTGMSALRTALNNAFSPTAVPDDSIRLGFQAMWRCRGFGAGRYNSYGGSCPENRVRSFSGSHRTGFNNWVSSLLPKNTTPSHLMVKNVGEYMKTTGIENPYNKVPGSQETPVLACRKSFHIFMTDGGWNSEYESGNDPSTAGNADFTPRTLPDGVLFDPQTFTAGSFHPTNVYRDQYGSGSVNTLSDFVFDYWATDLQPSIANELRPIIKVPGGVNYGTVASPKILPEYWNPRNDPATWQHLMTYTIGFGGGATLSTGTAPKWSGVTGPLATWTNHSSGSNGYNDLILGNIRWGNAISGGDAKSKELWHMAINGRGRHVSANNAADLNNAFAEIVNQILQDTSNPLVAISANTQSITSGTKVYVAGYDAEKWSGYVRAYSLDSNNSINPIVVWDSSAKLDAISPSTRLIFTHNGTNATTFTWGNLASDQQAHLQGADTTAVAQNRLNFLRGDRTQEEANGGTFRTRDKRHGDIVNSSTWYVGKPESGYTSSSYRSFRTARASRTPIIYTGANDGMLHGFSAAEGTDGGNEKIAYVPRGVYANLSSLAATGYVHRYFVDGHPFSGDFYNGANWRTALVGTLGGGGKGFFLLDVTDPAEWATAAASSVVITDKTASFVASPPVGLAAATWDDMGHMYAAPTIDGANAARVMQVTQLNNGRWAVLLGNGVNSTSEKAVLLFQYLDGSKELVKLEAGTTDHGNGSGNGLAHPQVIDLNGDGKADVAYAGDLKGNLWKFDLTNADPANWAVAYSNEPLFVARDTAGNRQPITSAPVYVAHPSGGLMLAFGTGREMTESDRTDTSVQTLYAIWDNATVSVNPASASLTGGTKIDDAPTPLYGRNYLIQQTQTETLNISGQVFYKTSSNTVPYTGAGAKRGWFLDWPGVGERTISNGGLLNKRLMFMRSRKPAIGSQTVSTEETCLPNATPPEEYLTLIDMLTGKPSDKPVFDDNGGGVNGGETVGLTRWKTGKDPIMAQKTGLKDSVFIRPRQPSMSVDFGAITLPRVGWRQLQ